MRAGLDDKRQEEEGGCKIYDVKDAIGYAERGTPPSLECNQNFGTSNVAVLNAYNTLSVAAPVS